MKCENHLPLLCRSYVVVLSLYGRVSNKPIDKPPKIPTYIPMVYPKPDFGRRKIKVAEKKSIFFLFMIIESTSNGSLNFYHQIPGIKNRHLLVAPP